MAKLRSLNDQDLILEYVKCKEANLKTPLRIISRLLMERGWMNDENDEDIMMTHFPEDFV